MNELVAQGEISSHIFTLRGKEVILRYTLLNKL